MVEVCGMSVVGIYHDPNVKKLEISGDRYSVENISEATREALDDVLAKSFGAGSDLQFVNLRRMKASRSETLSEKEKSEHLLIFLICFI